MAVSLAALIIISGCSQEKEVVDEQPEKQVEDIVKEDKEIQFQYPLTGVKTEIEPMDRAVAVVVNNHPQARPQTGLHKADIVYEVLAEGKVTRFLAIFESERPEKVGPVRSARDYYIDLAKGYDSIFIAHGYSPEAKEMLMSGEIDNLNGIQYDGSLFKRVDFRYAPHNSYITFENIVKGAEDNQFSLEKAPEGLAFLDESEIEGLSGQSTEKVEISYGNSTFDVQYEYNKDKNKYHRISAGETTVDLDSNQPVQLDNVLIVEMNHEIVDNAGRRDINLASGGQGYLLRKGLKTEVEWKNVDGRILPFIDGAEAEFVPGKTWINIVPSLDRVSFGTQS
ncbi:Protein of unknown function [Mesobacillus persicus]|uniref:Lipoprotein YerB n=1 Tax=Mesobacillus persicus TaxID=930146 RepID=A0A1H8CBX8_9BACI|nr:Protein of unknown function [Mesobacillus persicus]